ncbi:MAG TPA: hypothetical protein VGI95_11625 [Caulobacteraceae bacterium]|jgi:hypothetical protein
MTGLVLAAALAIGAVSTPLNAVFDRFEGSGDVMLTGQVIAAIETSPALVRQLDELATSGALKSLTLGSESGPLGASHKDGVITLTPAFVDEQTPADGSDLSARTQIGERDLVFVLGYMASKLKTEPATAAAQARLVALNATAASTPKGGPIDGDPAMHAQMALKADEEARAYLQGWNDEIDAQTAAKGAPLTGAEAITLLQESRNAGLLRAAANAPPNQRLETSPTFEFPATQRNIDILAKAIWTAEVPDFM